MLVSICRKWFATKTKKCQQETLSLPSLLIAVLTDGKLQIIASCQRKTVNNISDQRKSGKELSTHVVQTTCGLPANKNQTISIKVGGWVIKSHGH